MNFTNYQSGLVKRTSSGIIGFMEEDKRERYNLSLEKIPIMPIENQERSINRVDYSVRSRILIR